MFIINFLMIAVNLFFQYQQTQIQRARVTCIEPPINRQVQPQPAQEQEIPTTKLELVEK